MAFNSYVSSNGSNKVNILHLNDNHNLQSNKKTIYFVTAGCGGIPSVHSYSTILG